MFKKTINYILFLLILVIIPQISLASFVYLESPTETVVPNKTFNIPVYINPDSSKSYTTEIHIDFPPEAVSIESFNYSSFWIPINQPDYDLIDNQEGKMVKTAGYPGGFDSPVLLGTIILKSKKAGTIDLSINKKSLILDSNSNNTLNESEPISIVSEGQPENNRVLFGGILVIAILGGLYYSIKKKIKKA